MKRQVICTLRKRSCLSFYTLKSKRTSIISGLFLPLQDICTCRFVELRLRSPLWRSTDPFQGNLTGGNITEQLLQLPFKPHLKKKKKKLGPETKGRTTQQEHTEQIKIHDRRVEKLWLKPTQRQKATRMTLWSAPSSATWATFPLLHWV